MQGSWETTSPQPFFSEIDRVETITFLEKELKKIEGRISEEEVQANLQNLNMLREDKSSPQAES